MAINKKEIRWGIIGPGWIAHKFAEAIRYVDNTKIEAVLSRSIHRARDFANNYDISKAYSDYTTFISDPEIDIVYIATPHSMHYSDSLFCLDNNKPVLCEKPLAINSRQVKEMISKAKEKGLFFMEAMWTAFLPSIQRIKEIIDAKIIGDIEVIRADFGIRSEFNSQHRHYNKILGGGSLLDLGIYPVYLAYELLGIPFAINAMASIGKTFVDENCSMLFQYENGQMAHLLSSIKADTGVEAVISGAKGRIHIHRMFFMPVNISLYDNSGNCTDITPEYVGNGYNYEILESIKCIQSNKIQSDIFSHKKSIELIGILDKIREKIGLSYTEDEI